jgi:AraC family transcriptional regulator
MHLAEEMTLDELAKVACFSKFHFSRIFSAITGETLFRFISRVRIEKAAVLLIADVNKSITDIAFQVGFSDISIFSRNFKQYFGISAGEYRKNKFSNISQIESKQGQRNDKIIPYYCPETHNMKWRTKMKLNQSIDVTTLPDMTVAYVRYVGPYKGDGALFQKLFNKLFSWAGPRGVLSDPDLKTLIIYHDDPEITEGAKLRTSVCVTVSENTKVDGEIGKLKIEGGLYAIGRFKVKTDEFQLAWDTMCGKWLPESGYLPDDKPCFEMYPEEMKESVHTVDICIPIKPM